MYLSPALVSNPSRLIIRRWLENSADSKPWERRTFSFISSVRSYCDLQEKASWLLKQMYRMEANASVSVQASAIKAYLRIFYFLIVVTVALLVLYIAFEYEYIHINT